MKGMKRLAVCAMALAVFCTFSSCYFKVEKPWASPLTLSSLQLSAGTLSPGFEPGTTSYTAAVSNEVSSITVTPTATDPGAGVKVNNETVESGTSSGAINLNVGANTVTVEVTARSGEVNKYTITVTRLLTFSEIAIGSTTTITFPTGTVIKIILAPTVSGTPPTFPTGMGDSGSATVPAQFFMSETDTAYQLWKEVSDWATDAARGEDKYTFANAGQNGTDGLNNYAEFSTSVSMQYPVTKVSWRDAIVWCNALTEYYNANNGSGIDLAAVYCSDSEYKTPIRTSTKDTAVTATTAGSQDTPCVNASAQGFRLPVSTEYEFAARYIGATVPSPGDYVLNGGVYYYKGTSASGAAYTDDAATFAAAVFKNYNSGTATGVTGTAEVKSKAANALGLYDMSGNVWKWCFEWHTEYPGTKRVMRGGSFENTAAEMQVGNELSGEPYGAGHNYGFRVARTK